MNDNKELDNLAKQIVELEGTSLASLHTEFEIQRVSLTCEHWNGHTISIVCKGVLLCNVSAMSQKVSDTQIVGAKLEVANQQGDKLLASLGYLWDTSKAPQDAFEYPLFHLGLEGEVCVAIVCRQIEMHDFNHSIDVS